ncbi:MAG: preprotein translocase subunit SecA [Clostridia bacterium]|nr:preprotein translocase subunit SecA [Clostridia bacterium]
MGLLTKIFGDYSTKELKRIEPIKNKVLALDEKFSAMSEQELKAMTGVLKSRLENGETLDDILPEAFATCREAAWRVLNMKHFPVQIIGGIILHQGRISEMRTGEGKTLVATLPAYLNALSGKGVHIVTVNDYLARRDSEWMGKVYRYLGLSVGLVVSGMTPEEKKIAYNADITYGTNNEYGFDYLRDNMVQYKQQKVQRGHNYAIVDEVDSILIDEARTPLIISGRGERSSELYTLANRFAKSLKMVKVVEQNKKEESDELYADADYIVDEKAKTATLTKNGVAKAERTFKVDNLMDFDNLTLQHHINQAIKAHGVMHRDIDYVVKNNEVIIVDEFTGRLMVGRRYNEGLHQAIEAKEGVKVENESKTLATITFQNYFRLYTKLSGMTGTAMTEREEFEEIYKLDVVEIPTNKPLLREDLPDSIYRTEAGKIKAIIAQIKECNEKGQPVLVGTVTIDKSEMLSAILKKEGIKHQVLNAKHHEREAEIVAQAGKLGAVTIATNMAGRGTDIMLGGNAEYLAKAEMRKLGYTEELIVEATGFAETDNEEILESRRVFKELESKYKADIEKEAQEVKNAGGLFILGTERHESRRIDNQLRGRAGRQGDEGTSRFFISADDDLMRIFGGERVKSILGMLRVDEDMPIEHKMLSNVIESSQRKVEGRNFAIRKNVLQYDDVMNRQREIIYDQRNQVLDGIDLRATVWKMLDGVISDAVASYCPMTDGTVWNLDALREKFMGWILDENDLKYTDEEMAEMSASDVEQFITGKAHAKYEEREREMETVLAHIYEATGEHPMREVERFALLRNVDEKWMDHIDAMEELKQGIGLRAYGNRDPVVEFRLEGFDMFDDMTKAIREDTVKMIFMFKVKRQEDVERKEVAKVTGHSGGDSSDSGSKTVRNTNKVGRNEFCPCGSGKKYKKCCGMNQGTTEQN